MFGRRGGHLAAYEPAPDHHEPAGARTQAVAQGPGIGQGPQDMHAVMTEQAGWPPRDDAGGQHEPVIGQLVGAAVGAA